ncbi:Uncharacterised protein [Mycobacterium tuberculosis]|nr:Uncharacterised protein [Mycobacterium tuberculosis]CKV10610.1 Uncharacterised protein [Mycobacterium tuberculosis]
MGDARTGQPEPAEQSALEQAATADRRSRRPAVRRDRRPPSRSRSGRTHRHAGHAGSGRRRRRTDDDRARAARPADNVAGRRSRHHRDGTVVGTGAVDPPPGHPGQGRASGRRQRGRRSSRRRVPGRGGQRDTADPPGGVRRGPGPHRGGGGGRLPAAGRGHGGPSDRAGARERATVSGSGTVRP